MDNRLFEEALEVVTERIGGHVILIRRPPAVAHWEVSVPRGILVVDLSENDSTGEVFLEYHHTMDKEANVWILRENQDPSESLPAAVSALDRWLQNMGGGTHPSSLMYYEAMGWCQHAWGNPHVTIHDASGHRECRWHTYAGNRRLTLTLSQDVIGGPILLTAKVDGTGELPASRFVRTLGSRQSTTWEKDKTFTPPNAIRGMEKWMGSWSADPPRP